MSSKRSVSSWLNYLENLNQHKAASVFYVFMIAAAVFFFTTEFVKQTTTTAEIGAFFAVLLTPIAFVMHLRRWKYSSLILVLILAALIGLTSDGLYLREVASPVILLPPIIATLVAKRKSDIFLGAVATLIILAVRAGGVSIYTDPATIVIVAIAVVCLVLSRLVLESQQRQTAEVLEKLLQISENIREVFFLYDPRDRVFLYVSPAMDEIWGFGPEHLYRNQSAWFDAIIEEDRAKLDEAISHSVQDKQAQKLSFRLRRTDGAQRTAVVTFSPVLGKDGEVKRITGVVEDFTEQSAALHELEHTEKLKATTEATLSAVMESLPVGVFVAKAPEGEPLLINKVGIQILGKGLDPEASRGQYSEIYETIREDGSPYPSEELPLYQTLKTGQGAFKDDVYSRRPDGKVIALRVISAPIIDDSGRLESALSVFEDITEEKLLVRAEKDFMLLASHHLRTPLTIVKNSTELLAAGDLGKLPKAASKYSKEALDAVTQAIDLVGKLLNIARVEAGSLAVTPEPLNLESIVKDSLGIWEETVKQKSLAVDLQTEKLEVISADRGLVKSIVENLISNAVLYSGDRGAIEIRLAQTGDKVRLSVKDSGYGIPLAEQERIFARFYRGSNIEKLGPLGHGLGLFLTKKIVSLLGGTISFTSEENKGSEFVVELPNASPIHRLGEPYTQSIE